MRIMKVDKRKVKGIGATGDSFYLAERFLVKAGETIGLPKKKNMLLKTEKEIAEKINKSRSGIRRARRFMDDFRKKAFLDTKNKLIKKRMQD